MIKYLFGVIAVVLILGAGFWVARNQGLNVPEVPILNRTDVTAKQLPNFPCIQLDQDLSVNSLESTETAAQVTQLQHFINYYFYTRLHAQNGGLEEDGIFGPQTEEEIAKLKSWPHFRTMKGTSVDSETRKMIAELTCQHSDPITIPVEFSVSEIVNGERAIASSVKEVNTLVRDTTVVPGSYGALNIELDNPINPQSLGVDFSKGTFLSSCNDTITGTATLSNVRQKAVNHYPAGDALIMGANLDTLKDVQIKRAVCGD